MHPGLTRLERVVRGMDSVLVAFSGGVDSALVTAVAARQLGDRAVALTAYSPTFPPEEAAIAEEVADRLGVRHVRVDSQELEREGYAANAGDRCYFCKSELFALAEARRQDLGLAWVADGTLVDDLGDHRPGLVAAGEHRVRHPLVEAMLTKADVRAIARDLGLPVWDKPSFACLGSRFPAGTRVTLDKLVRVQRVESALRELGFAQLRVRYHEIDADTALARIEVDPSDIARLAAPELRGAVARACEEAGFRWATVDLKGYRDPSTPGGASSSRSGDSGSSPSS